MRTLTGLKLGQDLFFVDDQMDISRTFVSGLLSGDFETLVDTDEKPLHTTFDAAKEDIKHRLEKAHAHKSESGRELQARLARFDSPQYKKRVLAGESPQVPAAYFKPDDIVYAVITPHTPALSRLFTTSTFRC